jgi:hypothetical protein
MNRRFTRLALAAACTLAAAGTARATTLADVHVPFPFTVDGVALPAGHYQVERLGDDPSALTIRDAQQHVGTIVLAVPMQGTDPSGDAPALTFVKGDHGFALRRLWTDRHDGWTLPAK